MPATPIIRWALRDRMTRMSRASAGFRPGNARTEPHIRRKFTSIEVTRMSTPRKKSPARWHPRMPSEAIVALGTMATRGVWNRGCTEATTRGTMPSSAQANIRRETPSSIAGRSFTSATAAPATTATRSAAGSRAPRRAAADVSCRSASSRTVVQGTAWYTAPANRA